uniref:Uncharacterized protein n=1 Tax=Anopheles atroparvus TaxID=41427 RepID=A0A182J9F5_ANOAO
MFLVVTPLMVSMVRATGRLRLRRRVATVAVASTVRVVLMLVVLVLVVMMVSSTDGRGASVAAAAGRFAAQTDAAVAEAAPLDGAARRPAGRVQTDRAAERAAPPVAVERRAEIRRQATEAFPVAPAPRPLARPRLNGIGEQLVLMATVVPTVVPAVVVPLLWSLSGYGPISPSIVADALDVGSSRLLWSLSGYGPISPSSVADPNTSPDATTTTTTTTTMMMMMMDAKGCTRESIGEFTQEPLRNLALGTWQGTFLEVLGLHQAEGADVFELAVGMLCPARTCARAVQRGANGVEKKLNAEWKFDGTTHVRKRCTLAGI